MSNSQVHEGQAIRASKFNEFVISDTEPSDPVLGDSWIDIAEDPPIAKVFGTAYLPYLQPANELVLRAAGNAEVSFTGTSGTLLTISSLNIPQGHGIFIRVGLRAAAGILTYGLGLTLNATVINASDGVALVSVSRLERGVGEIWIPPRVASGKFGYSRFLLSGTGISTGWHSTQIGATADPPTAAITSIAFPVTMSSSSTMYIGWYEVWSTDMED